ncbi:MAG: hypothetical protein M3N53_11250 [Actinomycetota bacterium]|nr:hypothetical protein [Actinomycetota bacterium]
MSMHGEEGPPPIDEKHRMTLRVVAIFACYALYFFLSREHTAPAALVGLGTLLLALGLIDRWTLRRRDRSGLMQVGKTILGVGLLGLGIFLYVTATDMRPVT